MKKKIIGILAAVLVFAAFAAGCSQQATPEETGTPATQEQQESPSPSSSEEPENTASGEPAGEESPAPGEQAEVIPGETFFGKVKSIVGNEAELELAKPPFDINTEGTDGGAGGAASASSGQQSIVIDDGGSVQKADEAGADPGDSSVAVYGSTEDGQVFSIGGEDGEKMELEYTGESKNILIPAGVEIINLTGGEATLDAVKKGSVLMVTVDESSGTPTATSIMIME